MPSSPTLLWLRRDLRLSDHPGWRAALDGGGPVVPVFILDSVIEESYGAAPLWRLGLSLAALAKALEERGSRLILRRGEADAVLRDLMEETGARRVVWSRLYDARSIDRDRKLKKGLTDDGFEAESVNASLLFEPWTVETQSGSFYKVFSPFWRAVREVDPGEAARAPGDLAPPDAWPRSDTLADWDLGRAMNRGAAVVERFVCVGEEAARGRLGSFVANKIGRYKDARDLTGEDATSRLSENLTYGEISPRTVWWAGRDAMERLSGREAKGAETFLKELVWREFAYHLLFHAPSMETENWREEWDAFPWRVNEDRAEMWRRGMTGIEMVDSGMREMYVTGTMHNRVRMLVASFLTKHLLIDWRIGEAWFRDCLIDWDPASNAMGWQWTAGSGPDAAPYFRVFNPDTQAEKFDAERRYRDRWLAEGKTNPHKDALAFFDAVPRSWGISAEQDYPSAMISLKEGRERALEAYDRFKNKTGGS